MELNLCKELYELQKNIYDECLFQIINVCIESESYGYGACSFQLNSLGFIFRIAKITPKKSGQFVTFWKRNKSGEIEPFNENDNFDFYLINVRDQNQYGQFVIPKSTLAEKGIITTSLKEGKRGFRIYPPWVVVGSKQAEKTQKWQLEYFLEIGKRMDFNKVKSLYKNQ